MSRATILLLAVTVAGCRHSDSRVPGPDAAPPVIIPAVDLAVDRRQEEPLASTPNARRAPTLDGCVILTGESKKSVRTIKLPGGATGPSASSSGCSVDAECIKTHTRSAPGDSHVALNCKGSVCTCSIDRLTGAKATTRFDIHVDPPCAAPERAKALLIEYCLPAVKGSAERGKR